MYANYTMAAHFKWYPDSEQTIVPFNAQFSFPSQANKCVKTTPRIPPKAGGNFVPGNTLRVEFPAQGYVNALNTCLTFDVTLGMGTTAGDIARFQNNIQSIFTRARIMYGSTPLEDIPGYNIIVRALTEWTATNQNGTMDQTSICEGIGGTVTGTLGDGTANNLSLVNARQARIQGIDNTATTGFGLVPNNDTQNTGFARGCTRRYCITFALGLMTQEKLLPTKWMASQLAIDLTLAQAPACIFMPVNTGTPATYAISNVNLIPELLEFDSSYDQLFLEGLRNGGVPLKFSSWHQYTFGTGGSTNVSLQIQEHSRSVKSLFAVQRRSPDSILSDSGALLFESGDNGASGVAGGCVDSYQYRIGGRYFPAAPVQCSSNPGTGQGNGAAEAFIELQKALNCVGDYRLSSSVTSDRWGLPGSLSTNAAGGPTTTAFAGAELDYQTIILKWSAKGSPILLPSSTAGSGNLGSSAFCMATSLETSNGIEISGLNAEEQADISLNIRFATRQAIGYAIEVYALFDAMIILRENNVVELIQ